MTLSDAAAPADQHVSLRERKKLATRRLLRRTVLDLVSDRGYSNVTVEDIAEAANVSPRTFFNYFPSKEAAIWGEDPSRGLQVHERIMAEPAGTPILEVLRRVMISGAEAVTEDLKELGGEPTEWLRRMRAFRGEPELQAGRAAQMARLERAIIEAVSERLGTDPDRDPYPGLLCAVATGTFRSCLAAWTSSGGAVPLNRLIDLSFRALADGLPENCELRQVTGRAMDRKDDN
jgi:AcrR family transcriptional regulator